MNQDKVVVAICIYKDNKLDHVTSSIESMLNQSYQNIEIIIYIDGKLKSVLNSYLNDFKENIKITLIESDENKGLGHGLNEIINHALLDKQNKYLARMDGDDIASIDRIDKQVEFLSLNKNIDVCGGAVREFGSSFACDKVQPPKKHHDLVDYSIYRCPFIHPTVMFRLEVFKTGIRYPTNYIIKEDLALWFELILKGFRFENLPNILLDYRIDESSLKRRQGFSHAFGEMCERMKFMTSVKKISLKNISLISLKFLLHLMPTSIMGFVYRYFR